MNTTPTLNPVILGGDIGVYAIASCFHQAYGVKSTVIGSSPIKLITGSKIVNFVSLGESADPESYVTAAVRVAQETPLAKGILLGNTDWHIKLINEHRDVLQQYYELPVVSPAVAERVADKAAFADLCNELDIPTPRTVIVDFSSDIIPDTSGLGETIIAKPAVSSEYNDLQMAGKKKVWVVSQSEAQALWSRLRQAGFKGKFLAQELIPGDDTAMRSLTIYIDKNGEPALTGSARVLLEDHAPTMLGNPVAMITEEFPELMAQGIKLLKKVNYQGFANFDIKVDPRDGQALFFEVNPRIGRNCFYMTAGGTNPMRTAVQDLVLDLAVTPESIKPNVLYTLLPNQLLLKYVTSSELRKRVQGLLAGRHVLNPLRYRGDKSLNQFLCATLLESNQIRKFRKYYPQATESSF